MYSQASSTLAPESVELTGHYEKSSCAIFRTLGISIFDGRLTPVREVNMHTNVA